MLKRTLITTVCCLTIFCNWQLAAQEEETSPLDNQLMYGIDRNTGKLIRHEFKTNKTTEIGVIRDKENNAYLGIEAAAFKPLGRHILAFWNDPSDELSKIVFVNPKSAKGTIVGDDLGPGIVTGATSIYDTDSKREAVYAVQEAKYGVVDFDIVGGAVVPTEAFAARITVLGAAITNGSYNLPVTAKFKIGSEILEPFGSYASPTTGNLNDDTVHDNIFSTIFSANSPITVVAASWLKDNPTDSGAYDGHWHKHMNVDTSTTTPQVKVLRNGDYVPDIQGFASQADAVEFIRPYVDFASNTIKLDNNQAIFLFELGMTDLSSAAADFQDLVVLVTLGQSIEQLQGINLPSGYTVSGSINVNPNNSTDNEFSMTTSGGTVYSRSDLDDKDVTVSDVDGTFYSGTITRLHLKPKGNEGQNTLHINGVAYELKNTDAITLTGTMTVRVYNDKWNKLGKAMGHWFIDLTGQVAIEGIPDNSPASWLVKVDTATGAASHQMDLHKIYDSLSAINNTQFYATFDNLLYKIDSVAKTETVIGKLDYSDNSASEFIASILINFSANQSGAYKTNTATASAIDSLLQFNSTEFGSLVSVELAEDPQDYVAFD